MLDRVNAGLCRNPCGAIGGRVRGYFRLRRMSFLDDGSQLIQGNVGRVAVDDNLDAIGSVVESLANRLPRAVRTVDRHVLLFNELLRFWSQRPNWPPGAASARVLATMR